MIIFTIIYGPEYPRMFFERTLPSLLTKNNLPKIRDTAVELAIFTLTPERGEIKRLLEEHAEKISMVFGKRVSLIALDPDREITDQSQKFVTSHRLLCMGIAYCLRRDAPFMFAVPDLIYADGTVDACWSLHRLTGKVVAIFNGRIELGDVDRDGATQVIAESVAAPHGIVRLFAARMAGEWRQLCTTDPAVLPTNVPQPIVFLRDGQMHIFNASPNPLMGRFEAEDLAFLAPRNFTSWDNAWRDMLFARQRLYVLTNLDLGMSVELEPQLRSADKQAGAKFDRAVRGAAVNSALTVVNFVNSIKLDALRMVPEMSGAARNLTFGTNMGHFSFSSSLLDLGDISLRTLEEI